MFVYSISKVQAQMKLNQFVSIDDLSWKITQQHFIKFKVWTKLYFTKEVVFCNTVTKIKLRLIFKILSKQLFCVLLNFRIEYYNMKTLFDCQCFTRGDVMNGVEEEAQEKFADQSNFQSRVKKDVEHNLSADEQKTKVTYSSKRNQLPRKNSLKNSNRQNTKYPSNLKNNQQQTENPKFSGFRPTSPILQKNKLARNESYQSISSGPTRFLSPTSSVRHISPQFPPAFKQNASYHVGYNYNSPINYLTVPLHFVKKQPLEAKTEYLSIPKNNNVPLSYQKQNQQPLSSYSNYLRKDGIILEIDCKSIKNNRNQVFSKKQYDSQQKNNISQKQHLSYSSILKPTQNIMQAQLYPIQQNINEMSNINQQLPRLDYMFKAENLSKNEIKNQIKVQKKKNQNCVRFDSKVREESQKSVIGSMQGSYSDFDKKSNHQLKSMKYGLHDQIKVQVFSRFQCGDKQKGLRTAKKYLTSFREPHDFNLRQLKTVQTVKSIDDTQSQGSYIDIKFMQNFNEKQQLRKLI